MALSLYNTEARAKVAFTPLQDKHIKLYVCGITVYDYCHIGHARVLVAFDVITRFLRSQGWHVDYVRNITDIDDKILNRAAENGEVYTDLTARFIDAMHEDEAALNVLRPDQEPRATAHIGDIIALIEALVSKAYAYQASNGDVYYRVSEFESYGRLSGKNPQDLLAGARIDVDEAKHDPRDFALWKAAPATEAGWPSPWGWGRPGWHIECSAMSKHCLGANFDIHGGGPDLPFPHHENEIAQSEAANGCRYANYWMHAGAVRVDGEKMSKSLGNFFTIRDVLTKYPAEAIRYLLVASHYRSPINYSEDSLKEAKAGLDRFYHCLRDYTDVTAAELSQLSPSSYYQRFIEVMNDDFNTREALAVMYDLVSQINTAAKQGDAAVARGLVAELKALAQILGILQLSPEAYFQAGATDGLSNEQIQALIDARHQAKLDKNWALADQIRDELSAQNIQLDDAKSGTTWRRV